MAPPDRHLRCGGPWTLRDFAGLLLMSHRFQSPQQQSARCSLRSPHGHSALAGNPGAKVSPKLLRDAAAASRCSPGESEHRRVLERRRTVRTADLGRFQPPVSRLRGARVSVSVPRGEGRLSGDISSWSHTRRSAADLSSCTTARSCEAGWASFPTSVVGAIVGALGCAFAFFYLFLIPPPLCASGCLCRTGREKEHNDG